MTFFHLPNLGTDALFHLLDLYLKLLGRGFQRNALRLPFPYEVILLPLSFLSTLSILPFCPCRALFVLSTSSPTFV